MGIEFRICNNDHKVVEDFLARQPAGVSAVSLDPKAMRHQLAAAEAASTLGTQVYFDPATERLTERGYNPGQPYFPETPYEINLLVNDADARDRLVDGVIQAHPDCVTRITPAHFYVADERSARLNLDLIERTRERVDKSIRPVLVLSTRLPEEMQTTVAEYLVELGVSEVELRLSPLGGEDESAAKIVKGFKMLDVFTSRGLSVTLGRSGNIGQCAVALGHASHYSAGVGMLERVNHSAQISRQKQPPKTGGGGPSAGIYLPGLAMTVPAKLGRALLASTDIRTRIGCRVDGCAHSVNGPAINPRLHYLHARASEMAHMEGRPQAWRATLETDRLRRAVELRELINKSYLPAGAPQLKTRTLLGLIDDIAAERQTA